MAYKIVKALQNLDLAKRSVKKGDQIELDEKEAQQLIDRGLAEEGRIDSSDAGERAPDSLPEGVPAATDQVRHVSTASMPGAPDNKMQPNSSNK